MSTDAAIRSYWIRHAAACRRIGAAMGKALGTPCVTNVWIPDGMKDAPADRVGPRERLMESLDAVFKEPLDPSFNLDAVEGKLFGLGLESYTVGSHEFYFGYAMSRRILYTLDTGHHRRRNHRRQDRAVQCSSRKSAHQPRRPLGQRPRRALLGDDPRRSPGTVRGASPSPPIGPTTSTPASTASRRG
jgi:hypothetical protein